MIQGELISAGRDCVGRLSTTPPHIHQGMETHAWLAATRSAALSPEGHDAALLSPSAGAKNQFSIGEMTQKHVPLIFAASVCATCGWRQEMHVVVWVWRRVMEKFFKQYFGEHYKMAG